MLTLFILLAALSLVFGQTGKAEVKEVIGEGLSTTKQDALTQAKRDAVEKGIGVMLLSETETKNFMIQKDVVITRTMGSVKKYKVLSQGRTPDGLQQVKIKAWVSLASIKADLAALKILLESMDKPRVMVLIQEIRKGESKPTYNSAVTAVLDYLTEKEFNMVDPAQVAAMLGSDDASIAKAAKGDPVAAAKLGRDNGAEVIMIGQATGSLAPDNPMLAGMKSGQADINMKIVDCQNGKVIAAKNAHSAKPHISEETAMSNALIACGKKIMDRKLFEKIVKYWQDVVNMGKELRVQIRGVDSFRKYKDIKIFLENVSPNVVKVTKRGWSKAKGRLQLTVMFKGNTEAFCEYIDGKKTKKGVKMSVVDFTSGTVKIKAY
jgi:hypothetical protein